MPSVVGAGRCYKKAKEAKDYLKCKKRSSSAKQSEFA